MEANYFIDFIYYFLIIFIFVNNLFLEDLIMIDAKDFKNS